MSLSIIIPKSNKATCNFLKVFHSIILLNTLGKLIEKVIGKRFQFQSISNNLIHYNQLGLKQHSTIDANVFLTYLTYLEWVKNLQTSTLTFDIAQFFPLINHQLLLLILNKASFDSEVSSFFSNYLISRKTQY